jgi:hypothetical protein
MPSPPVLQALGAESAYVQDLTTQRMSRAAAGQSLHALLWPVLLGSLALAGGLGVGAWKLAQRRRGGRGGGCCGRGGSQGGGRGGAQAPLWPRLGPGLGLGPRRWARQQDEPSGHGYGHAHASPPLHGGFGGGGDGGVADDACQIDIDSGAGGGALSLEESYMVRLRSKQAQHHQQQQQQQRGGGGGAQGDAPPLLLAQPTRLQPTRLSFGGGGLRRASSAPWSDSGSDLAGRL